MNRINLTRPSWLPVVARAGYGPIPFHDHTDYDTVYLNTMQNVYDAATGVEFDTFGILERGRRTVPDGWHPLTNVHFAPLLAAFVDAAAHGWVDASAVGHEVLKASRVMKTRPPNQNVPALTWMDNERFHAWGYRGCNLDSTAEPPNPPYGRPFAPKVSRFGEPVGPWAAIADCVVRRLWLTRRGGNAYDRWVCAPKLAGAVGTAVGLRRRITLDKKHLLMDPNYFTHGAPQTPPDLTVYATGYSLHPFLFEVNTGVSHDTWSGAPSLFRYPSRWDYCDVSVASQVTPPAYTFAYWCPPAPTLHLLDLFKKNEDLQALLAADEAAGFAVADWLQEHGVGEQEANPFHTVPGWCHLFRDFAPMYRTGVLA